MSDNRIKINTGRLARQYLRWFPFKLGMIEKGSYLLQLDELRADDVFIVSFPRSGNTWLRFIMAYALKGTHNIITNAHLAEIIPDVHRSKDLIDSMKSPRYIKCHEPFFEYFPKVIYVYRDYRDVLISYYNYQTTLGEYRGDLLSYIKCDHPSKAFGSWKNHVQKALDLAEKHPEKILLVSYENLLNDLNGEINRIVQFSGIQPKATTEEIAQRVRFDSLKEAEAVCGSIFRDTNNVSFFREGRAGIYKEHFNTNHLEILFQDKKLKELLLRLKYTS